MMVIAMITALLFAAPVMGAPTRVFTDGFEDGTINQWQPEPGGTPPSVVSTGCRSGTKCVSINWNGTVPWNDPLVQTSMSLPSFPYGTEAFTRFWIKIDPNMDTGPGGSGPKLFKWGDRTPKEIYITVRTTDGQLWEAPNGSGLNDMQTFFGSPQSVIFPRGTWHKVEHYMKTATAGIIKLWVDDVLVKTWNLDTTIGGGTWFPLWWASNWSGAPGCCDHDATNHLYVDDFEVYSDSTSGAATTGTMVNGDITTTLVPATLSQPANLRLN